MHGICRLGAHLLGVVVVAAGRLISVGSCKSFAQTTWSFDFTGGGVAAMGTFTTSSSTCTSGCLVTGITGSVSGFGQTSENGTISTLLGTGSFAGNDNLLYYPTTPYVDSDGISFTVSGGAEENFYCTCSTYDLDTNIADDQIGALTVTPGAAPAPIPGSGLLSWLALLIGGIAWRRKEMWEKVRRLLRPAVAPEPATNLAL